MKLEGKVLGYDKKIVAGAVYTLVIILVAFYAGAKYEKSKLNSLIRQQSTNLVPKQAGNRKSKTPATAPNDSQVAPTDPQVAPMQTNNVTAPTNVVPTNSSVGTNAVK